MEPGGLQTSNPKKYRVRQPKPRKTKALVGKPETLQGRCKIAAGTTRIHENNCAWQTLKDDRGWKIPNPKRFGN